MAALRLLEPHMTIFVGDFGEEKVSLVGEVANANLPKAVMLGNVRAGKACGWLTVMWRKHNAYRAYWVTGLQMNPAFCFTCCPQNGHSHTLAWDVTGF